MYLFPFIRLPLPPVFPQSPHLYFHCISKSFSIISPLSFKAYLFCNFLRYTNEKWIQILNNYWFIFVYWVRIFTISIFQSNSVFVFLLKWTVFVFLSAILSKQSQLCANMKAKYESRWGLWLTRFTWSTLSHIRSATSKSPKMEHLIGMNQNYKIGKSYWDKEYKMGTFYWDKNYQKGDIFIEGKVTKEDILLRPDWQKEDILLRPKLQNRGHFIETEVCRHVRLLTKPFWPPGGLVYGLSYLYLYLYFYLCL